MNSDFWALIDETRPSDDDPSRHADALTERLAGRRVETVRRFGTAFDSAMDALYRWDLWGAAYLALGGCGDDAFEYLRAWIIGRGESAWRQAHTEPEDFFLSLIGDAGDPEDRMLELGVHDGEPLLYAAGTAHERLTGEWRPARPDGPPGEPGGEAWEEDDLAERFPALAARVPAATLDEAPHDPLAPHNPLDWDVHAGLSAFSSGDHGTAEAKLGPLVDATDLWRQVHPAVQVDVAYVVGAVRLQGGDVDAAAEALMRIEDRLEDVPPVRRLLAQIELARGRIDRAGRWIDGGPEAERMDRALMAKLAWRQGRREEAVAMARREVEVGMQPLEHPWDVGGAIYQVGAVLAEAGDAAGAERAARAVAAHLGDASGDLPLVGHLHLLVAAVTRLQGRYADALEQLGPLRERLGGTDLAEAMRERGRSLRGLGRDEEAADAFGQAIRRFGEAGERWDAEATRRELDGPG